METRASEEVTLVPRPPDLDSDDPSYREVSQTILRPNLTLTSEQVSGKALGAARPIFFPRPILFSFASILDFFEPGKASPLLTVGVEPSV